MQPTVQIDAAVAHEGDVFLAHAAFAHQVEHLCGVHALHAAAGVAYNHYFVHAKLVYGHKERAHSGVEGIGDGASGILDYLDVAVAQSECRRQQFDKARVHAGDDGNAFVGVLCGNIFFIAFLGHEILVVQEYFFYHSLIMQGQNGVVAVVAPHVPRSRLR